MKYLFRFILLAAVFFTGACGSNESLFRAPGQVEGETVSVQTLIGGTIESVDVREGETIQKGQKLAELNRDKIENAIKELEVSEAEITNQEQRTREKMEFLAANIAYLKKQVQRFTRLNQSESIPGDQLERARLQLLEAETSMNEMRRTRENLEIQRQKIAVKRESLKLTERDHLFLSPIDGVVLDVYAIPGETALPGMVMLELLDLNSMYIETFIEETEMSRLRLNSEVGIELDGRKGKEYKGVIRYFGRKAEFSPKYILSEKEREALLYVVRIAIRSDPGLFKVGMPVTVIFRPESSNNVK